MSIRFAIKSAVDRATKEGDTIVRFSGTGEAFKNAVERESRVVGVDGGGNPKLIFTTGLDEKKVDLFKWYNKEEQKVIKSQIKEMTPVISNYYGGDAVIDNSNAFFWKKNRDVNILSLSNQDIDKFYDTKYVTHALLYLSIVSGAFMESVAPTKEWAESHQIPLYLVLETDDVYEGDEEITKSDAHAALSELRKDENADALFILAWCIQYDTKAYGAYLKSTSKRDLVNYHIKFIEGKLQLKKKKNCPKVFLDYVNKWNSQQTRPLLYTEAYVKAGEYFNFLSKRDNRLITTNGVEIGSTIEECVSNLMKSKYNKDFEELRDSVESKWKE